MCWFWTHSTQAENMLISIDLGRDRSAFIREETTIGECEQIAYLEKHWIQAGPEHAYDLRRGCIQALVCVRRWTGMPDVFSWPDLELELSVDSSALQTRYASLSAHIGIRTLKAVNEAVLAAMVPTETTEGNSGTRSSSGTATDQDRT